MTHRAHKVLVIFDLVSTLTDAGPRYVRAFADVCRQYGRPAPEPEAVMEMLGNKNLADITEHFIGPLTPDDKKKFMQDCNHACDALLTRPDWREVLYPHVSEALLTLGLRGVTLGIYTGTREDAVEAQLAYHHISDMFDRRFVRGKDNIRDAGQKNADLKSAQLRDIVATFRTTAGDAPVSVIVIGDSRADMEAAQSQGLLFAGFAADDTKRAKMQAAGVPHIMRDFADLPDLVERLIRPTGNDNTPAAALPKMRPAPRKHRPN